MEYLFQNWEETKLKLIGRNLFIFLDFDGTLAPIIDNPQRVFLSEEVRQLLKDLSQTSGYRLAIVSGRALKDIKKKIGLNIYYAGNYGLEIQGPKTKFEIELSPDYRLALERIKEQLIPKIPFYSGSFIEDKGKSLTLHYRNVEKNKIPGIKKLFYQAVASFSEEGRVKTRGEKMVLEVIPPVDWDKGKAVLWLLNQGKGGASSNFFPVYIGDDASDEHAFKALKDSGTGLGILVSRRKRNSSAQYYIRNTDETMGLLKKLLWETYARTISGN